MADTHDYAEQLRKLLDGERFVMLTSTADDGRLESRPMTIQAFDAWTLSFVAQADDDVVVQSDGRPVNVSVMNGGTYLSFTGSGRVNRDVTAKQALWNRLNEAYAGEPEDPANVILEIDLDGGAFWDAGNAVTRVLGLAKAFVTRSAPDGEHGTAQL